MANVKQPKMMTPAECVRDQAERLKNLEIVLRKLMHGMESIQAELGIAKRNQQVLFDIFIKKTALPIGRN